MKKYKILLLAFLFNTMLGISAQSIDGKGFQQFNIGDIEAIVLSDGYFRIAPVQPSLAPNIDSILVKEQLNKHYLSEKEMLLPMNILLLKLDDRLILFDAGIGKSMGNNGGWLTDNLQLIGISPEQITDIVLSHSHLDHIGGLIDSEGNSVYRNATIYISKEEYDFWLNKLSDSPDSKQNISEQIEDKAFHAVNAQFQIVEDGETILGSIQIQFAPGHTPGHYISTISSNGESMVNIADIAHSEALLLPHPEWGTTFDNDFDLGLKTRIKVLQQLNNADALIFGYHLSYPGIGRLKKSQTDSYKWFPSAFVTPQIRF